MSTLMTAKQLFMEELFRQKKSYIAEVGFREYENLYWLVMGSPPYVKTWQELKGYLGELTPEGQKLMDEEQRDNNNMSDTPRTDAFFEDYDGNLKDLSRFARELGRENAALREQIETLSGENRRLRQIIAAPAMITWAMHGKDLP